MSVLWNKNMKWFSDLVTGICCNIKFCKTISFEKVNRKSQNNQLGLTRPTFVKSNPCKLSSYPIMVSLDREDGSCTAMEYVLPVLRKICPLNYLIW